MSTNEWTNLEVEAGSDMMSNSNYQGPVPVESPRQRMMGIQTIQSPLENFGVGELENNCPRFYQPPQNDFHNVNANLNVNSPTPNGHGNDINLNQFQSSNDDQLLLNDSLSVDNEHYNEDGNSDFLNESGSYSEKESLSESENSTNENSDEDEEEDLDFDCEALMDNLETMFRSILDEKVGDVEKIYDSKRILQIHPTPKGCHAETQTETLETLVDMNLKNVVGSVKVSSAPVSEGSSSRVENKEVSVQTDDASASLLMSSVTASREEPDCARIEIGRLREARMELVNERKAIADQNKKADDSTKVDERQLYEYEEAIEAIDTAIEYKNEIICGQQCILSNDFAPGEEKAGLVTRLTSLSVFDVQRLLCKYFSKFVELRLNSRKLEKSLEKLEKEREMLQRCLNMTNAQLRKKDDDHEFHIKHLLQYCRTDDGMKKHYLDMQDNLHKAERKQLDFQRSLTELLIRHGYLLNGHDYDVRQVVKMLGIDTAQMGRNTQTGSEANRERDRRHKDRSRDRSKRGIPSHITPPLDMSGMPTRRTIGQRRNAQVLPVEFENFEFPQFEKPEKPLSSRKNYQNQNYQNYHGSSHHGHRDRDRSEKERSRYHHHAAQDERDRERDRGDRDRHHTHGPTSKGTEVRKEKHKLILQTHPNSSH